MPGLQGSKWASNTGSKDNKSQDDKNKGDGPKDESRVSVPYFGFVLPPLKPKDTLASPPKPAAASTPKKAVAAPAETAAPPLGAFKMPTAPPKLIEMVDTPPQAAEPEKQLSRAEIAATKTRARMAEIMGPRRPHATSSGAKGKGAVASAKGNEKENGDDDKDMSGSKGDVEMNLMD
ncbi:hypothetical protein HBI56_197290 [Parastagonospora nodorum]|nr:hypothetical protein HBH53_198700 [Parastagonospora nodorum]KAH3965105.1 hypothetical protein HBH52_207510 [Parastagonospora nodorum]KAH4114773.1 hypothetical protein HBH47_192490 [Parastagonospora nodorum]KAH4201596.1 hypothetical protein HBH42_032070 [Parastagonospora nodorum]KAH4252922.1 hypothetical protein HBI03_203390 [Parastagonospora nodorum]